MPIEPILIMAAIILVAYFLFRSPKKKKILFEAPPNFKDVLASTVPFYQNLDAAGKLHFENKLVDFLQRVRITGVQTSVTDEDRILVAASAVIPIFGFRDWEYNSLNEVLLYPGNFDESYQTEGNDKKILGMVGWGHMNGVMILSQHELRQDFLNKTGKDNTAIHEFVHLVDKRDGAIDGVPEVLLHDHHYAVPWLKMMHAEIQKIKEGRSDINPYGATNEAEFFAVAAEYFFERPELFKTKHPELYNMMVKVFTIPAP